MSPLVSIMTPCYNGEKFVGRYLDSVLAQTYDNIELVIVDDGSTDNTAAIIKSYIPKFESKGYKLIYVYQENGGAASALNQAIPILNGDFISWFDSDDILLPQSTEKRVNFLQQNPQYDFCMCQMYMSNENTPMKIQKILRRTPPPPPSENDSLFIDFLRLSGNLVWPNVWMVRREVFFKAHPTKKIFPMKWGQNCQLVLPLAYKFKCGYLEEPLCYYIVRSDSIGHIPRNLAQELKRKYDAIEMIIYTIKQLHAPNEAEFLNIALSTRMHEILKLGINHGDANVIYDCIRKAQENKLNIFGAETFDVGFLLANYILPRIELQGRLNATQAKLDTLKKEIVALNEKIKKI